MHYTYTNVLKIQYRCIYKLKVGLKKNTLQITMLNLILRLGTYSNVSLRDGLKTNCT